MLKIDARKQLAAFEWQGQLDIQPGVTALFGQSGAGKTSLVKMIAGLLAPDEGEITIGETCVFANPGGVNLPPERRPVSVVFQDGRLFPHLTVRANLRYGRRLRKQTTPAPALQEIVELLNLESLLHRRPMSLSGGEQQRVALGRALLAAPHVLLLDEPLAGLDPERREDVLEYLEGMKQEKDRVTVYVTHRMEEAVRLANRLALIHGGVVRATGDPVELLGKPELQMLTGRDIAGALLACRIERRDDGDGLSRLSCSGNALYLPRLPLSEGAQILVQVRAGDVSLSLEPPRQSSVLNAMRGTVERILDEDGAFADVVVDVGQTLWARVTRRSVRELGLAPGTRVYATIKSASLYSAN